jgi:hypothetical protein
VNEQLPLWKNTTQGAVAEAQKPTSMMTPSPSKLSAPAVAHSVVKLVVHEFNQFMGRTSVVLKRHNSPANQEAAILYWLHGNACRWPVWRRLVESAVERHPDVVWLTQSPKARELLAIQLDGRDLNVMSPAEYAKSVNRTKVVFCPVSPTELNNRWLDALLDADELHIIRSRDYGQERFFKELGRRATERGNVTVQELTYRDGR